jgi:hypothetical protein
MIRKFGLAVLFLVLGSVSALAADFNGKWNAEINAGAGLHKYTYEFHVDGAKVTGRAVSVVDNKPHGDAQIQDGKVDGDTISFLEVLDMQGKELKITYSGKIDGDTIKFTRHVGTFATEDFVATRAK